MYNAGAVAVVHNVLSDTQNFYQGHKRAIISVAAHPSNEIVATGDLGQTPEIHVYVVADENSRTWSCQL